MTPAQALTVIQTMSNHSQKWHDVSSSKNIDSSSNSEGIAAIVSILDSLGRDMKKLKDNVHAIQVGCQAYEGAHIDKECPLNKEVKHVEEVKHGKFKHFSPFSNGAKYRVGPPGYYICIDNRPSFGEKVQAENERQESGLYMEKYAPPKVLATRKWNSRLFQLVFMR
nr:hypothetical protein [Tanacetum cinerariifolium]GEX22111.1 hypothetical protein [Tanacetum cinerariifolium]